MKKKLILILSAISLAAVIGGAAIAYAAPDTELGRGIGNCFGWAASDAESFEEFQQDKIDRVEALVDEGTLTQDEADEIIDQIEDCDGDGTCDARPEEGRGLFGKGTGDGTGYRNGSCTGGCRR